MRLITAFIVLNGFIQYFSKEKLILFLLKVAIGALKIHLKLYEVAVITLKSVSYYPAQLQL